MFGSLRNPKVPRIAPDSLFLAMQKLIIYRNIMNIRGRGGDAVNQAESVVRANVHLHSKMPLIILFGLMHFWVTLTAAVLSRGRRSQNRGINDTAFTQNQPLPSQMTIDGFKDHFAEFVFFQKMPEVQNGCLVRQVTVSRRPAN